MKNQYKVNVSWYERYADLEDSDDMDHLTYYIRPRNYGFATAQEAWDFKLALLSDSVEDTIYDVQIQVVSIEECRAQVMPPIRDKQLLSLPRHVFA